MVSDRMAMIADKHIVEVTDTAAFRNSENPVVRDFLSAMETDPRAA
jgi:ABC-type transporter Mla maintaining outer membrane lipid asymmetry ATPase subunit MlaF